MVGQVALVQLSPEPLLPLLAILSVCKPPIGLGLVAPSLPVPALAAFDTCLYCYGEGVGTQ